jgi:hypothetical protein
MMLRVFVLLVALVAAAAFMPANRITRHAQSQLAMKNDLSSNIVKSLSVAAMGFALIGAPTLPANADGAVSDGKSSCDGMIF